jgi:hypothetical protein
MLSTALLERFKPILCMDSRERWFPQSLDGRRNIIYGRVATEGPDTWLTFWIWYACDESPLPWRKPHEGDWEYVQYRLEGERIGLAAYAQHAHGQVFDYGGLGKRPFVCVALGKHASYFTRGYHVTGPFDFDRADAKGREIDPTIEIAPDNGWAEWSFGDDPHSPAPPREHHAWRYPSTWARSLSA